LGWSGHGAELLCNFGKGCPDAPALEGVFGGAEHGVQKPLALAAGGEVRVGTRAKFAAMAGHHQCNIAARALRQLEVPVHRAEQLRQWGEGSVEEPRTQVPDVPVPAAPEPRHHGMVWVEASAPCAGEPAEGARVHADRELQELPLPGAAEVLRGGCVRQHGRVQEADVRRPPLVRGDAAVHPVAKPFQHGDAAGGNTVASRAEAPRGLADDLLEKRRQVPQLLPLYLRAVVALHGVGAGGVPIRFRLDVLPVQVGAQFVGALQGTKGCNGVAVAQDLGAEQVCWAQSQRNGAAMEELWQLLDDVCAADGVARAPVLGFVAFGVNGKGKEAARHQLLRWRIATQRPQTFQRQT